MKNIFFLVFMFVSFNFLFSQVNKKFIYTAQSNSGERHYVLETSYEDSINSREIWVKSEFPTKAIINKKVKIIRTDGRKYMSLFKINCEEKKYDYLQFTLFDEQGNVIETQRYILRDNYIVPQTTVSSVYEYVCKNYTKN